jgi:hypothetical protein
VSNSQGCSLDDLKIELDAMQTIAQTLADLRDHDMRLRVLRWMNERFAGATAAPDTPAGLRRKAAAADPCLSVDGLNLFDERSHLDMPVDVAVTATDFGVLAAQWQSA